MTDNKSYYENKILYALSKIEYAKSKMSGKKNNRDLTKIYQVLMTYGENTTLKTVMDMTKLGRDIIVKKLKELKDIGVLDWDGINLSQEKEIELKKPNLKEWYIDFCKKMKKSGNQIPIDAQKVVEEEIAREEKLAKEEELAKEEKSVNEVEHPLGEKNVKVLDRMEKSVEDYEWVEIPYSDGVILKVKKENIKKYLL